MKKPLVSLIVAALAVAALSGIGPAAAATAPAGPRMTLSVWFERGGKLWLTKRTVPRTPGAAAAAINRLFAGPNSAETSAGVASAVPAGSALRGVSITGGVATVDVASAFAAPAARTQIRMRLAQLTYTVTQFPTVSSVRLEVNGRVVNSIDGAPVPQPAGRGNFFRLLPPILVSRPAIGALIPSGSITVAGTADVFEAALTVRVINAHGRLLVRKHFLASCGTGCRGTYSVTLPYHLLRAQQGTVVIFDGGGKIAHPHIVRVPVRLSAG
jgi:Sporulation and spore germination/Immunoglobulin-like domain of bacterial spore germination